MWGLKNLHIKQYVAYQLSAINDGDLTDLWLYTYIYKADNCKLLVVLTRAQKTKLIFK